MYSSLNRQPKNNMTNSTISTPVLTEPSSSSNPDTNISKINNNNNNNEDIRKSVDQITSIRMDDPNFLKYLKILNIDPVNESHLIWIAEEGYVQPLGTEWRVVPTDDGEYYFVNRNTGEYTWEHPFDKHYRKMVEDWRNNDLNKSKNPPIQKRFINKPLPLKPIKRDSDFELLSDEEVDKIYSSDSATIDDDISDEDNTSVEFDENDDIFNDKEFFITSPRIKKPSSTTKNTDDINKKKVTFSKHLVKIYEFDNEHLQWKRSNLFRKQNSNDKPSPTNEIEDNNDYKNDKINTIHRPGTPLIVPTERFRRLKNVQKRADQIVYRNWREFCIAVTESYANVHQLAAFAPTKILTHNNNNDHKIH